MIFSSLSNVDLIAIKCEYIFTASAGKKCLARLISWMDINKNGFVLTLQFFYPREKKQTNCNRFEWLRGNFACTVTFMTVTEKKWFIIRTCNFFDKFLQNDFFDKLNETFNQVKCAKPWRWVLRSIPIDLKIFNRRIKRLHKMYFAD